MARRTPDTTSGSAWDWYRSAACLGVDTAVFFPVREAKGATTAAAKRWCRGCLVRQACLDAAVAEEAAADRKFMHGIRGGLTVAERRHLRDRHATGQAVAS